MNNAPIVKLSRYGFEETVQRLLAAIAAGGNTVFASIDQSAAAAGVGMELRPTTLILFGNPKAGTPVMAAWPLSALELPLRLLVWQEGAEVKVAFPDMPAALGALGVPLPQANVAAMAAALEALTAATA